MTQFHIVELYLRVVKKLTEDVGQVALGGDALCLLVRVKHTHHCYLLSSLVEMGDDDNIL